MIPAEWEVSTISESCEKPTYGYTASASQKPVGVRFLRITDITEGKVDWESVPYCDCSEEIFKKYALTDSDILFARIGGTTGKSFLVKRPPKAIYASYLIRVRTKSDTEPDFLYYFFNTDAYWKQINQSKGNNLKGGVNGSILSQIVYPLPPLSEQRTIAAIVSKIHEAIGAQEKTIEVTKELKKAMMAKLFTEGLHGEELKETEIGMMPKSWRVTRLGSLFKLSSGSTRPSDTADKSSDSHPYPVYGGNGILGYSQSYFITEPTLVLGRVGAYCGNAYVTDGKCWISDNALYAKEIFSEFDLLYMCEFLRFYDLNRFRHMGGQPLITQGIVHEQRIPMPSICEQTETARILSTSSRKISTAENKRLKLQQLFRSMLYQLMTGQIRVNNLELPITV